MEPAALSAMAATIDTPAEELQDFDRVVQLYRPVVFRFILASLRDHDDAETLTQDCFLRAFRHRHRFRGDAAVKTWLMQIAANLVRDLTRSRRFQFWKRARSSAARVHDLVDLLSSREASPEARTLLQEQLHAVWSASDRLSEKQRAVFVLRFVEDMDLLEIADVLRMKEGTVKKHLFRALHTVREQMRRVS